MDIATRKKLLAAALLVAFEDGRNLGVGHEPLALTEHELLATWRSVRKRSVKSYWLSEAARVLAALEVP